MFGQADFDEDKPQTGKTGKTPSTLYFFIAVVLVYGTYLVGMGFLTHYFQGCIGG